MIERDDTRHARNTYRRGRLRAYVRRARHIRALGKSRLRGIMQIVYWKSSSCAGCLFHSTSIANMCCWNSVRGRQAFYCRQPHDGLHMLTMQPGRPSSPHKRMWLVPISSGAALSERHLVCPPQLPLCKDFITGLEEGTDVPAVSRAIDGERRASLYIAAVAVVAGALDRGGVGVFAASFPG